MPFSPFPGRALTLASTAAAFGRFAQKLWRHNRVIAGQPIRETHPEVCPQAMGIPDEDSQRDRYIKQMQDSITCPSVDAAAAAAPTILHVTLPDGAYIATMK